MEKTQKFGGIWTIEKLDILRKYLALYSKSLKEQKFRKIYIDAFAGSGEIQIDKEEDIVIPGSTRIALKTDPEFDEYVFIEKSKKYCRKLEKMVTREFHHLKEKVRIINGDANIEICKLIKSVNWHINRGVIFIDPYASQFSWSSLEKISKTKALDVWYLFPYNVVNRLITRNGIIDEKWEECLDRILGTNDWRNISYKEDNQISLFNDEPERIKVANLEIIEKFLIQRLETVFAKVAKKPRTIYIQGKPYYIFFFAISNNNENAQKLAMKFAKYILEDSVMK